MRDPIKDLARRARNLARRKANRLVETGKVTVPESCSRCGANPKPLLRSNGRPMRRLEMHHPDHSDYARIEWLCLSCHHEEHGNKITSQYMGQSTLWAHNAYVGCNLKISPLDLKRKARPQ